MIPAIVIGGYLGAGKTTLINRLLAGDHGQRVTVLVNDFGAVNIDAALIENRDGGTISLTNGCACCTIGDDLVASASDVAAQAPPPDMVLVEASGAAEPARMAVMLLGVGHLMPAQLLTIVDGGSVTVRMKDKFVGPLVQRQMSQAEAILVNRMPEGEFPDRLADVIGDKLCLSGADAAIDWILNTRLSPRDVRSGGDEAVHHGLKSCCVRFEKPVSMNFLETRKASLPANVHRVKGFLPVLQSGRTVPEWYEVQYDGRRWHTRPASPGNSGITGEVILIGTFNGQQQAALQAAWQAE